MRKILYVFLLMFGIFNMFAKEKILNKKEQNSIILALSSTNESYSIKTVGDESITTLKDVLEDLDIIKITKENEFYFIYAYDYDDNITLKLKNNKLIEIKTKNDYLTSLIILSEKTNNTIYVNVDEDDGFYELWYNEDNKNLIKSNYNGVIYEYNEFNQIINEKGKYEYKNELLDCEQWYTYQNENLIYVKGVVYDSTIKWEYYYDYDEFNRKIYERFVDGNECYITKYKYDNNDNIIEKCIINDSDSVLIEYKYNENEFIVNVKFIINGDSSWTCYINGYKFEVNSNCEYNIEKLSEKQIKIIPTNDKNNWYILNKE